MSDIKPPASVWFFLAFLLFFASGVYVIEKKKAAQADDSDRVVMADGTEYCSAGYASVYGFGSPKVRFTDMATGQDISGALAYVVRHGCER